MGKGDLAKGTLGILLPRLRDERITFFFPLSWNEMCPMVLGIQL